MNELFDIAVIGGGVNGAGLARDAAGRGAKVLLLERGDLACGTSSASTKLIHGGLRYLEHREFALVREALQERERLWSIAPHIIAPMRFVLPHHRGMRPRWMLRAGLFLYAHPARRDMLPPTQAARLAGHPTGAALRSDYRRAFIYSDCWVDDARLVVLNAMDARERGAQIYSRCPVTALSRAADHWQINAGARQFRARFLVNAAGPRVLELCGLAGAQTQRQMRLVRGSHIIVPSLFSHDYAYILQLSDGRIIFAIPYERDFTLIGTTDADQRAPLDAITPSAEEIAYLCAGANSYFTRQITPEDVVWSYAGVRALLDDGSGRPEEATRGYQLEIDTAEGGAPMLSIFGGKITSYRHLAETAVSRMAALLPALSGPEWTATAPLPGGDFPRGGVGELAARLYAQCPALGEETAQRMARAYGSRAFRLLGDTRDEAALGAHFGGGLYQCEVDYLIAHEWAKTSDDVLWRRSKLGLRLSAAETEQLARYMQDIARARTH